MHSSGSTGLIHMTYIDAPQSLIFLPARSEFLSSTATGQSVYGKKNMKLAQAAVRKTPLLVGFSIQNLSLIVA